MKSFWKKFFAAIAFGLAFGLMAGGTFVCVNRVADHFFPRKVNEAEAKESEAAPEEEKKIEDKVPARVNEAPKDIDGVEKLLDSKMTVPNVVEGAMPSIVSITNQSVQQVRSMWGMGIQEYESSSVGSGIIVGENDDELLIATNNHVVEKANSLTVGFVDDEVYEASLKGADPDVDLAIISVKLSDLSKDTKDKISVAIIGESDDLVVGEQVVAIGNALGYGQSVTTGIVSALDREVTIEGITNNLIQTDAAINPGNSGGALLNMRGELVGINSAKFASAAVEGMGYAIPVSTAVPIIEELMNRETRDMLDEKDAGYLGITGLTVDKQVSDGYGIPEGVYLQEVEENGPADKAGLIKGDVIRKLDGVTVRSIAELKDLLLYYPAGESVDVVYYRANEGSYDEKTVKVTLGDRKGTALDTQSEDGKESKEDVSEDESEEEPKDDRSGDDTQNGNMYPFGDEFYFDFGKFFGF